jgi:hypothetical protein
VISVFINVGFLFSHSFTSAAAAPDENVLHFLVELFKLPIPESIMRRLIRKLCENRLLEFLEHAFVTGVFSTLHQVAPSRVYEFMFASERNFISMLIKRLSGNSEVFFFVSLIDFLPHSHFTVCDNFYV